MDPNMHRNLFQYDVCTYLTLVTRKLQGVNERRTYRMTALLLEISIFHVKSGCKMLGEFFQFLSISHLYVLTCITWKLQVVYGRSTYQMTSLLSATFLVWFRVAKQIQLETYGFGHTLVILWYKLVCTYCKPVYISLFGAQLCMTIKIHVLYDCILHTVGAKK